MYIISSSGLIYHDFVANLGAQDFQERNKTKRYFRELSQLSTIAANEGKTQVRIKMKVQGTQYGSNCSTGKTDSISVSSSKNPTTR